MNTHNIQFEYNKNHLKYLKYNNIFSYGIFCQGFKNEIKIAVVNEPSVFEPLKFYCIHIGTSLAYFSFTVVLP